MSEDYVYTRVSITFKDVAACFSEEEWALLEDWQKELFRHVMMEIHGVLNSLGYGIANPYTVFKIKMEEEQDSWDHIYSKGCNYIHTCDTGPPMISPDILLSLTAVKESHTIEEFECEREAHYIEHREPEACESITNPYKEINRSEMHPVSVPEPPIPCETLLYCDKENSSVLNATYCKIETFPVDIAKPPLKPCETQSQICNDNTCQSQSETHSPNYKDSACQTQSPHYDHIPQSPDENQSQHDNIPPSPNDTQSQNVETILHLYEAHETQAQNDGDFHSPYETQSHNDDEEAIDGPCETESQDGNEDTIHGLHETQAQSADSILLSLYETHVTQSQIEEDTLHEAHETKTQNDKENALKSPDKRKSRKPGRKPKSARKPARSRGARPMEGAYEPEERTVSVIHYTAPQAKREFQCTECSRSYSDHSSLLLHQKIHTLQMAFAWTEGNPKGKPGQRPYKCTNCDRRFSRESTLTVHMRLHKVERPYKCTHCEKCFKQSSGLVKHNRKHTGEKPYKCTICGKCFSRSSCLGIHQRIHTGEKPYKCTNCEKSFSQSYSLIKHFRTHTGEKPYKCPNCDKCFNQKQHLQGHQKAHTMDKWLMCTLCGEHFELKAALYAHHSAHKQRISQETIPSIKTPNSPQT